MTWPTFLRRRKKRPSILMYHRVADVVHDPWGLAVPPAMFDAQMERLARRFRPIALDEFARRCSEGGLRDDHVAVTFDDAYPDNLRHARPSLVAHGIPATVFIISAYIGSPGPFWWDELAALCLASPRGCDLNITVGDIEYRLHWGSGEPARAGWRAADAPPGPREQAYAALYAPLQRTATHTRASVMAALRQALGPVFLPDARSMTREELALHLEGGLIQPGGHSLSHPPLSQLERDEAAREIEGCAVDTRQGFGPGPFGFAYPYGDLDAEVACLVRRAGFAYACSTQHGSVDPKSKDMFALPRIAVGHWEPDILDRVIADA